VGSCQHSHIIGCNTVIKAELVLEARAATSLNLNPQLYMLVGAFCLQFLQPLVSTVTVSQ